MTDLLLLKHGKHTVHKMRTSVETKGFQWCFFFLSLYAHYIQCNGFHEMKTGSRCAKVSHLEESF